MDMARGFLTAKHIASRVWLGANLSAETCDGFALLKAFRRSALPSIPVWTGPIWAASNAEKKTQLWTCSTG